MRYLFAALLIFSSCAFAQTSGLYCGGRGPYTVPAGDKLYCSTNVQMSGGTCNGIDQVMSITANTTGTYKITPWENQPIMLRGVEVNAFSMGPVLWAEVGNGQVPDIILNLGPGQMQGRHDFPAGMGMPIPASSAATPSDYFDLHIACSGGGQVNAFVTLYYTPNGPITPSGGVTWNPADKGGNITLGGFNLTAQGNGGVFNSVRATTSRSTGKYHWENVATGTSVSAVSVVGFGTSSMSLTSYVGNSATSVGIQVSNGSISANGFSCGSTGVTFAASDVMAFEVDLDAKKIWLAKNGTWVASGNPAAGTNPLCTWTGTLTLYPAWSSSDNVNNGLARFAAGSFTTTISSGFSAWE